MMRALAATLALACCIVPSAARAQMVANPTSAASSITTANPMTATSSIQAATPIVAAATSITPATPITAEVATQIYLQSIETSPPLLRAFFARMPKGADLHNHASGAVYAETMLGWALADGDCANAQDVAAPAADGRTCPVGFAPITGGADRTSLIDAWSMNGFVATNGETGHDHFFNTFGKFGATLANHTAGVVAEATRHAAEDHVAYLETMVTFANPAVSAIAAKVPLTNDLVAMRRALDAAGFPAVVDAAVAEVAALDRARRTELGCDAKPEPAPCAVTVRYLQQANRVISPAVTFAQFALGFELAKRQPLVVGLNLVAPEDNPVSLREYALHMRMIGSLHAHDPNVNVSLHAGELTLGLVPPADLKNHIRQAIEVAGAKRIGHGVDVSYETDALGLLREMHEKRILVEIALTSNDVILGVRGAEHPLPTYLRAGVPTALATDDEGVSRIDFTNEFVRAITTYHFTYPQIKTMVRNSVHFGFLQGTTIWADPDYRTRVTACANDDFSVAPSAACQRFLSGNEHAAMEARVERELADFEASVRADGFSAPAYGR